MRQHTELFDKAECPVYLCEFDSFDQSEPIRIGRFVITVQPLLAIDVGNSRIKYGLFKPESTTNGSLWPQCVEFAATPLAAPVPWETLRGWLPTGRRTVAIAGSNPVVVNETAGRMREMIGLEPWVLRDRSHLPLAVDVDLPDRVGLDRLLNAVAVNVLRPATRPAIVIDSGTATTVDFVSADGVFRGGSILPGFALAAEALHRYTAQLPRLGLADLGPDLPDPLGKNTEAALRSGIYWGQVGAVRQIIDELCRSQKLPRPQDDHEHAPWLLLTGGGAAWLGMQYPDAPLVASLAMHGLVLTAWQVA